MRPRIFIIPNDHPRPSLFRVLRLVDSQLLEEKDFACVFQVDGSETITWDKQTRLRVSDDGAWSPYDACRERRTCVLSNACVRFPCTCGLSCLRRGMQEMQMEYFTCTANISDVVEGKHMQGHLTSRNDAET